MSESSFMNPDQSPSPLSTSSNGPCEPLGAATFTTGSGWFAARAPAPIESSGMSRPGARRRSADQPLPRNRKVAILARVLKASPTYS
jgi:hypothetical protein